MPDKRQAGRLQDELGELIGEEVVLDVRGPYIFLGTLESVGAQALTLASADVHFVEPGGATNEVYIRDAAAGGIYPTRKRVFVMRNELVSISRLADVIQD